MTGMGGVNLGLFVPPMKDDLGFGQTVFGLAQTARLVGFSVTGWLVGRYLDRFGARLPLIVAGLIMGFSVAAVSLIDAGWQMVVLFLIGSMTGLQGQGANLYSTVPIARWFQRKRGKAFSLTFLGIPVGIFVLSPLSQFLIDNVGWRDTWLIMAVMGTNVTILVAVLIIRRQPDDMGLLPDGSVDCSGFVACACSDQRGTLLDARRGDAVVGVLADCVCGRLANGGDGHPGPVPDPVFDRPRGSARRRSPSRSHARLWSRRSPGSPPAGWSIATQPDLSRQLPPWR